ncbi:hypothetical protein VNO77_37268 [Canavalia gladiata]|uniref:Uncharacterized protein n=1 Tax=Canavalia gladiata TaxID=3824 RepID=A0AAN9K9W4_CANGL
MSFRYVEFRFITTLCNDPIFRYWGEARSLSLSLVGLKRGIFWAESQGLWSAIRVYGRFSQLLLLSLRVSIFNLPKASENSLGEEEELPLQVYPLSRQRPYFNTEKHGCDYSFAFGNMRGLNETLLSMMAHPRMAGPEYLFPIVIIAPQSILQWLLSKPLKHGKLNLKLRLIWFPWTFERAKHDLEALVDLKSQRS